MSVGITRDEYNAIIGEYEATIKALRTRLEEAERERDELKKKFINRRELIYVDASPDEQLPYRILNAYIEETLTTDNLLGLPPENPLCKLMNEQQQGRNKIIRKALISLAENAALEEGIKEKELIIDGWINTKPLDKKLKP